MGTTTTTTRPLSTIAYEIQRTWGSKINYAAAPYLDAMGSLTSLTDKFGYDSADSVVRYFLSNSSTWRGEDSRRIKSELRAMLSEAR
jgi:hypothetical protein